MGSIYVDIVQGRCWTENEYLLITERQRDIALSGTRHPRSEVNT
jgi:hypothetical protein